MTKEQLYQEYLRTVMRTKDETPVVDFRFWCWQHDIPFDAF